MGFDTSFILEAQAPLVCISTQDYSEAVEIYKDRAEAISDA